MLTRRRPHAGSSDDSAYGAEDDASKDKSTSAKWYIVAALLISALLLTPEHQGEPSFVAIETTRALDTLSAESQSRDQRSLLPSASSLTETGDVVSANSKAAGLATSMLEPIAPSSVLAESPRPRLVQKNVLRHAAMVELPSSPFDGKPVGPSANEDLWKLALGAATVRGEDKKPRLSAFKSKRVGPRRHDGLSFKAGEDGCPPKPKGAGKFVKGDHRLAKIHFVHPPKSGGTTFGLVTVAVACELNSKFRETLDCCTNPADWCGENCEPTPDCSAIFGCSLCDCHHIPRLHRMQDATYSVTIIRHPMTRYISGYFYRAHSPNWDRFGLRPGYFSKDPTYPFRFSFEDYMAMPEYHNILVKMFARDQFPYFNATLSKIDVVKSKQRLSKFLVVGINEAYDASVQLLLKLTGVSLRDDQIHLPAAMTSTYSSDHESFKQYVRENPTLTRQIYDANTLDVELYEWSVQNFCTDLCAQDLESFDKRGLCQCKDM